MHNAKEAVRTIFKRVEHHLCLPQIDHSITTVCTRKCLIQNHACQHGKTKHGLAPLELASPYHLSTANHPLTGLSPTEVSARDCDHGAATKLDLFFFLLSYSLWSFSTTSIFRTFHRGGPLRLSRSCFPSLSNFSTMRAFRVPHILVPVFLFQTRPAW